MLANTASDAYRNMTNQALESMYNNRGTSEIEMRCVLVETNVMSGKYLQPYVLTHYPGETFNYNRFMNLGYLAAKSWWPEFFDDEKNGPTNPEEWQETRYVCLLNNDIYCHPDWAWELAGIIDEEGLDSGSPLAPGWQFHNNYTENSINGGVFRGWGIGHEFTGWVQMYKYSSFEKLYPLDEDFSFWAADNSMTLEMQKLKMDHALIVTSKVTHFTSSSHALIPPHKHHEWTTGMGEILARKAAEGRYESK